MRISPFDRGAEIKKQVLRYEYEKKETTDRRQMDRHGRREVFFSN